MTARARRVVVGYDGSEHGRRVLRWAADEASRRDGVLVVVNAADYRGVGMRGPVALAREWQRTAAEEARGVAMAGAALVRGVLPGLAVDTVSGVGAPVPLLVRQSENADLMVVGAHGEGREASERLGGIAESVAGRARCPVVVIDGGERARPDPHRPVVVGVDGSDVGLKAADFAAAVAADYGARLHVVSGWPRPRAGTPDDAGRAGTTDLSRAAARAAVDEAVAMVRTAHPSVVVDGSVLAGQPHRVLCDRAAGAGMLVVGRRARPRPTGALGPALGSVGLALVRTCPCPVVFVGPPSFVLPSPQRDGRGAFGSLVPGSGDLGP